MQSPITNAPVPEGAMKSTVLVSRGSVSGEQEQAPLSVNAVEIPQKSALGVFLGYDFASVTMPGAPGEPPMDQSQASAGQSLTVSWSGPVDHLTPIKPDPMIFGFDPQTGVKKSVGPLHRSGCSSSSSRAIRSAAPAAPGSACSIGVSIWSGDAPVA